MEKRTGRQRYSVARKKEPRERKNQDIEIIRANLPLCLIKSFQKKREISRELKWVER